VCSAQNKEPYGFIYIIENKVNGKAYVGKTVDLEERYKAHSRGDPRIKLLFKAIKKYGFDLFIFSVVESCGSLEELDNREKFWIQDLQTLAPNGYNLTTGGTGGKLAPEVEIKRVEKLRGKGRPNSLSKMGSNNPAYGKKASEETRQKMSIAHSGKNNHFFGKEHSQESKDRMRKASVRENLSEETLSKMRNAQIGKRLSEKTKNKLSEALSGSKNPNFGKTMSDEQKRKISETKRRKFLEKLQTGG
jgi:group I intron endonuclease